MKRERGQPGGWIIPEPSKPPERNSAWKPAAMRLTQEKQPGQATVFFTLILTGLLLLTAVGIEVGRIVYARGEVGNAADAAALAAVSRINVALYRETGEIEFLPDVYVTAQNYASMNSAFLRSRHISVVVTGISANNATQVVSVTVAADLSSLIPGILPFKGIYQIQGTAEARMDS
jgi:Flp pilus assembly protein TadG